MFGYPNLFNTAFLPGLEIPHNWPSRGHDISRKFKRSVSFIVANIFRIFGECCRRAWIGPHAKQKKDAQIDLLEQQETENWKRTTGGGVLPENFGEGVQPAS